MQFELPKTPTPIDGCFIMNLEAHGETGRGSLTVAQNSPEFPLKIKRIFYIYDIPAGAVRGGHAHFKMNELVVAVTGCVDVEITDGLKHHTVTLRHPGQALFLPAGIWRSLCRFSAGCVVLSLCDTDYDEADYIRHFDQYIKHIRKQ